jgi:hypothetical protein
MKGFSRSRAMDELEFPMEWYTTYVPRHALAALPLHLGLLPPTEVPIDLSKASTRAKPGHQTTFLNKHYRDGVDETDEGVE